jgi:AraC-like DNA-binding protein
LLALTTGCKDSKGGNGVSEGIHTAQDDHNLGLQFDMAGKMHAAELYYRKAYEALKDNPSQDWNCYADAGYRYACILWQRGNVGETLTVVSEILDKAERNKDFPVALRSGLLSLMAHCQLQLAMTDAAKQTYARAYENQLTVLGSNKKGDFNLAIMCANIFLSFFDTGEYNEAEKWLSRYEEELHACEQLGIGDSLMIEEHEGILALYKARYLHATGHVREAAAVFAAIPLNRISMPSNISDAANFLIAAGRYDEAAYWFGQIDSITTNSAEAKMTFDLISDRLAPRYIANMKAGRTDEALSVGAQICAAIDSAITFQKQDDAAELAVIYQTHERDLQIKDMQFTISLHRLILVAGGIILALIGWLLWRSHIYNKVLLEKNRHLLADAELREQEKQQAIEQLKAEPEDNLTSEQLLFRRICDLMDSSDRIYTNPGLGRNHLAQLLGTNEHYITDAISACTNGKSVNGFLNEYRLRYAAHLLVTTKDPVALIAELAGFSRSSFFRVFSEAYGMSPSDYRKVAGK